MGFAEEGHDRAGIHALQPEQPRYLIGKGHFGGVERVAGVLERLSRADVDDPHRLVKEAKQITDMPGDTKVGCSYDKEPRGEEAGNPGTLPEELPAHPCSDGERDTAKPIDNRRYHSIPTPLRHGPP